MPDQVSGENGGDIPLDLVFEGARMLIERSLRDITGKGDDQNREKGCVELADCRFFCIRRQFCLRQVYLFAYISERVILVETDVEFENNAGMPGGGDGRQLFQPLQRPEFRLHRLDEQAFSIFRRNTMMDD